MHLMVPSTFGLEVFKLAEQGGSAVQLLGMAI